MEGASVGDLVAMLCGGERERKRGERGERKRRGKGEAERAGREKARKKLKLKGVRSHVGKKLVDLSYLLCYR